MQRGSDLIIAMLVIVAISAASLGLARIFLADVRVTGALEETLMAYFAAEAGVEEGLLRYRTDRHNAQQLNEIDPTNPLLRPFLDGSYALATWFRTDQPVDTRTECPDPAQVTAFLCDFPQGEVGQDQTVEVQTTPNETGTVRIRWEWQGATPTADDCGVEITDVQAAGSFTKQVVRPPATEGTSADTGGRTAIRVKPLCQSLSWLRFEATEAIGRTVQTIESTGTIGRAKRKLVAVVNRRAGSMIGLFDFVLGSEEDIIVP